MNGRESLEERGRPELEVRVQCSSHREAVQLLETLRWERLPCVRRSSYLLVGAPDQESTDALAKRLGQQAPRGASSSPKKPCGPPRRGDRSTRFSALMSPSVEPDSTGSRVRGRERDDGQRLAPWSCPRARPRRCGQVVRGAARRRNSRSSASLQLDHVPAGPAPARSPTCWPTANTFRRRWKTRSTSYQPGT